MCPAHYHELCDRKEYCFHFRSTHILEYSTNTTLEADAINSLDERGCETQNILRLYVIFEIKITLCLIKFENSSSSYINTL